ncbi:isopentenyl phosphate kinase [Halorubrum distributum]|uniref:Isopentenyl phosphate kinase n=2 Tax=Halorubrum distributum TaxID=29283 RepID=M0NJH9_9EURY|nr:MULTISPECIES: isopentenyl phosphate kinase [Halorubrum distributum group]EMA57708.1 aspartate/glutamate/uridylate kinase [Halorubrum litoreum JCM 13561]MDV7348845.1 isopentenyl phosphate kinase [Halorubrum distributum]MYL15428.1 acetylglutamate kinase [Halorubrum terrestre]MYL66576.1 acetylglutamate kinase [Halorubrum terrestre]
MTGGAADLDADAADVAAPPVVLKLGGSLITEKGRPETLDDAALDAACDAVAGALAAGDLDRLVVVHGGGSFGHHHASEHGVSTTDGTRDADAVAAVHGAMKRLNAHVLERLRERGVPVVPVHPLSLAARSQGADGGLDLPLGSVATLLGEGFVPVLHGDGVATARDGVTVVSGDELVVELAAGLGARRVGVCSTVPGVLDGEGDVIDEIDAFDAVADALGASDATDVSGGMAAKVRELLALDAPAYVFGAEGLAPFLRGEAAGTRID